NAGLKFRGSSNFFGTGSFNLQASTTSNDSGLGGSVANAQITVTPVADTPSISSTSTLEDVQTTTGLVVSRKINDGAEVTHFKITTITNGTLYLNDGVTPVPLNSFVTFAQANAGLKFTPNANLNGSGTVAIQASTSNSDTGLGGSPNSAVVMVTA